MARINFTAGRVAAFTCPPDRQQAFLWDDEVKGLGLRAKRNGAPAYIFQRQHAGKTVRLTIGSPAAWTIPMAREKAREFQRQIDAGHNPADLRKDEVAAKQAERQQQEVEAEAERQQAEREAVTVGEAWAAYVAERREHWGERHLADNTSMAQPGGEPHQRQKGALTRPGILHPFMAMRLMDVTAERVEAWTTKEAKTRPARLRLALRLLKAFLRWCAAHPNYKAITDASAASSKKARETAGRMKARTDAIQREQLPAWFAAVQAVSNPVISAYLQTLLLTGARPNEALMLRWEDLNLQWKGLTIRDKVEGERQIPLTPYVRALLVALPRRGPYVFQSARDGSKGPRPVSNAAEQHDRACAAAGLELTLHGLRRSFGTLSEWLDIPAGVVAQIMGHKPSATAEKHYRVRPLDLLRVHHERIEAWMLEQAGIQFDPAVEPGKLRAVS